MVVMGKTCLVIGFGKTHSMCDGIDGICIARFPSKKNHDYLKVYVHE